MAGIVEQYLKTQQGSVRAAEATPETRADQHEKMQREAQRKLEYALKNARKNGHGRGR